jgi:protein SERAC1
MGTPHTGSHLADWTSILTKLSAVVRATNGAIVRILQPGSEMLANLQQEFHTMLDARQSQGKPVPRIYCFFEELPFNNIIGKVVPSHSAILTRYGNQGIHANHVDMTKFADRKDQGYRNISGQLRIWTLEIELEDGPAQQAWQPNLEEIRTNRGKKFGDGGSLERSHVYNGPVHSDGGVLIQGNLTSSGDINLNHSRDLSFKRD